MSHHHYHHHYHHYHQSRDKDGGGGAGIATSATTLRHFVRSCTESRSYYLELSFSKTVEVHIFIPCVGCFLPLT